MVQFNINKSIYALLLFLLSIPDGVTQEKQEPWLYNFKVKLDKEPLVEFWERGTKKMVGLDKVDRSKYLANLDSAFNSYEEDSVTSTELTRFYRGATDLITYEDPHFRIFPQFILNADNKDISSKNYQKVIKALPFRLLQINDSLIVDESINENIFKGDLILSINGATTAKLLHYTYRNRYINSSVMQRQYHMMFTPNYDLELVRNGKTMKINVAGASLEEYNKLLNSRDIATIVFGDIGYIEIEEFHKNNIIIKKLNKLIKQIKDAGGHSVVIDLRRNPGGSGDDFDKLISIFTPKEKIDYLNSVKVMISEKTIPDYGHADSIGRLVTLPSSEVFHEISLQPNLYMGKMDYYVLISINTGSMASSFANIVQYNNLGKLIGEPLRYNATKYGEVNEGNGGIIRTIYSTVEFDEYTKAKDGIIRPDIRIPYIAKEYMNGGDPMLEKLLKILNSNDNLRANL